MRVLHKFITTARGEFTKGLLVKDAAFFVGFSQGRYFIGYCPTPYYPDVFDTTLFDATAPFEEVFSSSQEISLNLAEDIVGELCRSYSIGFVSGKVEKQKELLVAIGVFDEVYKHGTRIKELESLIHELSAKHRAKPKPKKKKVTG